MTDSVARQFVSSAEEIKHHLVQETQSDAARKLDRANIQTCAEETDMFSSSSYLHHLVQASKRRLREWSTERHQLNATQVIIVLLAAVQSKHVCDMRSGRCPQLVGTCCSRGADLATSPRLELNLILSRVELGVNASTRFLPLLSPDGVRRDRM